MGGPFAGVEPGSVRALPVEANGTCALGCYQRPGAAGAFRFFGLMLVEIDRDGVGGVTMFLTGDSRESFGLPETL